MTLSDLSETCDTCSVRATFTGRTDLRDGHRYAILRCPSCHSDIPVWSRETEALVEAWAADPLPEAAMMPLRGADAVAIAAYLLAPPNRVPAWRLTDVAVPAGSAVAWSALWLDHPGLFPRPTFADRMEESLAAALQFNDSECAELAAERIATLTGAETGRLLMRLPSRAGDRSGSSLRPFLEALRAAGGEYAAAVRVAAMRWALPGLREGLLG